MQCLLQLIGFDNISHACSYIKSIQSTQSEQLTRTSQCLFIMVTWQIGGRERESEQYSAAQADSELTKTEVMRSWPEMSR